MKEKKKIHNNSKSGKYYSEYYDDLKPRKSEKSEWKKYGKNLLKVYNYN